MSSINVDYDVLNQKGSPAWFSDLFANLPTPGFKGRMFISIDTFAFYRDNGVGWDLVGGPGTGTITGAGVNGQVTFFSGTDVISGNANLVYDNVNSRLGINTATPGAPLDIHTTGTAAQFNGTGTNNAFVTFQNSGTSKWRTGNIYNSADNDYQIFDVLNSTARLTIKNTGASTLIGTFTATSLIKSGGTNLQILLADGTTTPTSTFGAGSVTNVSAITLGTSGTDLTSTVANSTTTPVITLNVPTASATNRGALSSADFTTFNNKQATITLTTSGTSGAATLVGATLNVPNYTNVGTVTSVAALTLGTSGTDLSSSVANSTSTPVITLNVPTASAINRGALSSADFTTFNNKQATISVTAPVVLTGATISMPAATTSVNGYLTSTDWNTFNNKTSNLGTVTDVVALTIGTSGIDITSSAVTTTTTPVITLNVPTASATNRGALSSTDWTTFNNKQSTVTLTTTGTSGAATFIANTLNIPQYSGGGGMAIGGSITSATAGSVLFAGASGVLAQSNANFFWDNTNNRLGIGTTTIGSKFQVNGSAAIGYSASTAAPTNGLKVAGAVTFDSSLGIGTTPSYPLHILTTDKTVISSTSSAYGQIQLGNPSGKETSFAYISNVTAFSSGSGAPTSSSGNSFIFNLGIGLYSSLGSQYSISNVQSGGPIFLIDFNGGAFIGFSYANNAQTTRPPTDGLAVVGDVGIGTTTIGSKLQVNGNAAIGYSASTAAPTNGLAVAGAATFASSIQAQRGNFYQGASSGAAITMRNRNATQQWDFVVDAMAVDDKYLGIYDFTNSTYRLVITNGGALGLGTQTIGSKLQVNGNAAIGYSASTAAPTNGLQVNGRGNFLNATDNALFSLNSGGTLYTVGFSPTATASSTNTFTLTTGTTTWIYTGSGAATWTLPNPSGNNQIYWIKNAGTGAITLTAFSGTNIIDNSAASVSTVSIAVGATVVIAQDGNVKSYQLQ